MGFSYFLILLGWCYRVRGFVLFFFFFFFFIKKILDFFGQNDIVMATMEWMANYLNERRQT